MTAEVDGWCNILIFHNIIWVIYFWKIISCCFQCVGVCLSLVVLPLAPRSCMVWSSESKGLIEWNWGLVCGLWWERGRNVIFPVSPPVALFLLSFSSFFSFLPHFSSTRWPLPPLRIISGQRRKRRRGRPLEEEQRWTRERSCARQLEEVVLLAGGWSWRRDLTRVGACPLPYFSFGNHA